MQSLRAIGKYYYVRSNKKYKNSVDAPSTKAKVSASHYERLPATRSIRHPAIERRKARRHKISRPVRVLRDLPHSGPCGCREISRPHGIRTTRSIRLVESRRGFADAPYEPGPNAKTKGCVEHLKRSVRGNAPYPMVPKHATEGINNGSTLRHAVRP